MSGSPSAVEEELEPTGRDLDAFGLTASWGRTFEPATLCDRAADDLGLSERQRVAVLLRHIADHVDRASVTTATGSAIRLGARMLDEDERLLAGTTSPISSELYPHQVLNLLRDLGTLHVRAIAEHLSVEPRAVSHVLSSLRQRRLVACKARHDTIEWHLTNEALV